MPNQAYLNAMNSLIGASKSLICAYCGVLTPAYNDFGICHNCENIIYSDRAELMGYEPELLPQLDYYNDRLSEGSYGKALEAYEGILVKYVNPQFSYVSGLTCIKYSNYEVEQIRYDLEGFMEGNVEHRDRANQLYANARMMFNKAIFDAKKSISAASTDASAISMNYVMMLSHIKLGNLRGAEVCLHNIDTYVSENSIPQYSRLIFDVALGDYKKAISDAEAFITTQNYPITTFYYLAFSFFKTKRYDDAYRITKRLNELIPSYNTDSLLKELAKV